jgi:hypothetical protein
VPTLNEFAPRFLDGYARANRQKPSGIAAEETIRNVHLLRLLGPKRLDAIGNEQVQRLKHSPRKQNQTPCSSFCWAAKRDFAAAR